MRKHGWLGMFLFGLGTQLQIVASLSFTELFVLMAAPLIISKEWYFMRRNGILPFFWLSVMMLIGCIIACIANHTPVAFALRGLAVCCLIPCAIVVSHWLLRRNMNGFKWMMLGSAISQILCTFAFRKSVETAKFEYKYGAATSADIMGGPIYWIQRLGAFVTLPARGWYLKMPLFYSASALLFMAGFSMMTSSSGRSAALGAIAATTIIVIGGKKRQSMKRLCKWFWMLCLAGIVGVVLLKEVYAFAATHDWLGEASRLKYERQSKGSKSIKKLLLGGRFESFCGLLACIDKPIVGFGPWAMDDGGYIGEFLSRYGEPEDFESFLFSQQMAAKTGNTMRLIPGHSHFTEFWLWYGIWGLVLCFYILFVVIRYIKQDCWAVPQYFMWCAAGSPSFLWGLFFSPFAERVGLPMFIVAMLLCRAVRKGKQQLPIEMQREIMLAEK